MKTYQLNISIAGTKPKVWRQIIVKSDILLPELHSVLQTIMGWSDTQLHRFIKDDREYFFNMDDTVSGGYDYLLAKLDSILFKVNDIFYYEYDFAENWIHEIVLEKISEDKNYKHPVCLDGKNNAPDELVEQDNDFEEIIDDMDEYESFGEFDDEFENLEFDDLDDFEPKVAPKRYFALKEINAILKNKDFLTFI